MGCRKGKTLVLITLAYMWVVLMEGRKLLSNIPLDFKDLNPYLDINALINTKQFDEQNFKTIIIMDEGQRYFDRHDHNKPETKFVMGWAVDLRKDDCQIVSTIQYLDWLEKRARDFLQLSIVPEFINHYSLNESEEIKERLRLKDFWSHWKIIDYKTEREFDLVINMYPFINMYDTRFKPKKLVTEHKEYIDFKREKWSGKKMEEYLDTCKKETLSNIKNWVFFKSKLEQAKDENKNGTILDELHSENIGEEIVEEDIIEIEESEIQCTKGE